MPTILAQATSSTSGTGTTATATLNNVSGTDVAILALCSSRSSNVTFTVTDVTWDGGSMTLVRNVQANLNGFPRGIAHIRVLPIGNPSSLTASCVLTLSSSNQSREITVYAVEGIDQTTPVIDDDGSSFTSAATGVTDSVTSSVDDIVFSVVTLAAQQTATNTTGFTKDANVTKSSPATFSHIAGSKVPADSPSTTCTWTWSSSSFCHAIVSLADSGFVPGGPPVITEVISTKGTNAIIPVTDKNITINGTNFQGTISTKLFYSSSATFGAEIMVEQPIDTITATSLNWLEPQLGDIGRGMKFIFIRTNEGEIDEETSAAFAVQVEAFVSTGAPELSRVVYVCTGSESGPTTVVSGLGFTPKAAVIASISTANLDSVDPDSPSTLCLVAGNGTMGDGLGAKSAGGTVLRRKQASGTGSLIVVNSASTSATDLVTGTPSLTSDGMDINFTNTTANVRLYISLLGGDDISAEVREIQINDGSVTGLPFAPELAIGTSVGLTQGSSGDNTFSLRTWGIANSTDQCILAIENDTSRNCNAKSGSFLGQLTGTSYDWEMSITSFTGDGITWTGSNADSAYILFINLNGRGTFIAQFATDSANAPGMSENLPDFGFVPELIAIQSASRTTESVASAVGARYSLGTCSAALDNRCTATKFLPATGGGTAEQFQSEGLIFAGGSSGSTGSITFSAEITVFGQISTIRYPDKEGLSFLLHILAIEQGSGGETIAVDADGGNVTTISEGNE